MNKLILILILYLILFGCKNKFETNSELIGSAIYNKHKEIQNRGIKIEDDTIIIKKFILDPYSIGYFSLDTSFDIPFLYFGDYGFSDDSVTNFFQLEDLNQIKKQLKDNQSLKWDNLLHSQLKKSNIQTFAIEDSTVKNIDLYIWSQVHYNDSDYLTMSKPIFNSNFTKAIIGTKLYNSDYLFESVFKLINNNNNWIIQDSRTKVHKFVNKNLNDNELRSNKFQKIIGDKNLQNDDDTKLVFQIYKGMIKLMPTHNKGS